MTTGISRLEVELVTKPNGRAIVTVYDAARDWKDAVDAPIDTPLDLAVLVGGLVEKWAVRARTPLFPKA